MSPRLAWFMHLGPFLQSMTLCISYLRLLTSPENVVEKEGHDEIPSYQTIQYMGIGLTQ